MQYTHTHAHTYTDGDDETQDLSNGDTICSLAPGPVGADDRRAGSILPCALGF